MEPDNRAQLSTDAGLEINPCSNVLRAGSLDRVRFICSIQDHFFRIMGHARLKIFRKDTTRVDYTNSCLESCV